MPPYASSTFPDHAIAADAPIDGLLLRPSQFWLAASVLSVELAPAPHAESKAKTTKPTSGLPRRCRACSRQRSRLRVPPRLLGTRSVCRTADTSIRSPSRRRHSCLTLAHYVQSVTCRHWVPEVWRGSGPEPQGS